jgi:Protein of unknown function (DUF1822)
MMAVVPKPDRSVAILLRVSPMQATFLPAGLSLSILEAGETVIHAQSRIDDNYIQVKFAAQTGDQFGVQVELGEAAFMEQFVI